MPYKISGSKSETARVIILKESDWSIESNTVVSGSGEYEVVSLESGNKLIFARTNDGWVEGYGAVVAVEIPATGGDRGVFAGGYRNSPFNIYINVVAYITISTTGNASDFGDLTRAKGRLNGTSNGGNDRGVIGGGTYTGSDLKEIDYITILSPGDAQDFGDLSVNTKFLAAASNGINDRGLFGGGYAAGDTNVIEYITVSTTGNAQDFGDLTLARDILGAVSNGTNERGVFAGAQGTINVIDYVTISTPGNALDFGDLTIARGYFAGVANDIRGCFGGGHTGATTTDTIDYITIATTSDAVDFGNLTAAKRNANSADNRTGDRGTFGGGYISADLDVIEYITISTISNAQDFGDLTITVDGLAGISNA